MLLPGDERRVEAASRLLSHAEGAIAQARGHILRGRAEAGDLVIVNRRRTVHREVRDHAAAHEIVQQRCDASLHDMAAEHHDDAAFPTMCFDDRLHDFPEILRLEHVGERAQEGAERAVVGGGLRKGVRIDLVRAGRDRNGAHAREVDLARRTTLGAHGTSPTSPVLALSRYERRYRLSVPNESRDFI